MTTIAVNVIFLLLNLLAVDAEDLSVNIIPSIMLSLTAMLRMYYGSYLIREALLLFLILLLTSL